MVSWATTAMPIEKLSAAFILPAIDVVAASAEPLWVLANVVDPSQVSALITTTGGVVADAMSTTTIVAEPPRPPPSTHAASELLLVGVVVDRIRSAEVVEALDSVDADATADTEFICLANYCW